MLRTIIIILFILFLLAAIPFVVEHVAENFDAPEYPYTGFTPDLPTWPY